MTPANPAPPTPRGRPRSEARNAEILWAAAQLFARDGIAGTSTRAVAAHAQTTERTLFKHFGSKDGLVRAVLDEAVLAHLAPASLQAMQQAIATFSGDFQAWHRALLAARVRDLSGTPELTRLLLTEMLRDPAVLARFTDAWRPAVWEPLLALFSDLQQRRLMRQDTAAEALVRQFLSLNLGFLIGRLLLAPGLPWRDHDEIAALARGFADAAGVQL